MRTGRPRSLAPRSKPCAECGLPIVKRFPSELKAVTVHGHCRGIQCTRRVAFNRLDTLEPRLRGFSSGERRRFLEGYRLGAIHTAARYKGRLRRLKQQEAAPAA